MEHKNDFLTVRRHALDILRLMNELKSIGVHQKDLVPDFGLVHPAITNLKKGVLEKIRDNQIQDIDELEEAALGKTSFKQNIWQSFDLFVIKLQKRLQEERKKKEQQELVKKYESVVDMCFSSTSKKINASKGKIKSLGLLGLYDLYAINSENRGHLVKLPMMITENEFNGSLEVYIGTNSETSNYTYSYKGFVYLVTGDNILKIVMIDNEYINEAIDIHFSVPHRKPIPFLRGILLAIDTVKLPLSTRVVIIKKGNTVSKEEYVRLASTIIDVENPPQGVPSEVIDYLKDGIQTALLCHPDTRKYSLDLLTREKEHIKKEYKDFTGFE